MFVILILHTLILHSGDNIFILLNLTTDHGFGSFVVFCAAYHNLNVCIVHIPGVCNDIADSLSFPDGQVQEASPTSKHHTRQHPYLASAELHARLKMISIKTKCIYPLILLTLSHFQMDRFRKLDPQANTLQTTSLLG